jgi:hypothetical protein
MGNDSWSFFKKHAAFNLPLIIAVSVSAYFIFNSEIMFGLLAGYILCLIYALVGYISFESAYSKSNNMFLKYYFGGMIIRMFLLLLLLFLLIKYTGININSFLFSTFIFYVLNLVLELQHIIIRQNRLY